MAVILMIAFIANVAAQRVSDLELTHASGLVGFWAFEETSGATAYDSSLYNNNGIIFGPVSTSGKLNLAFQFDGTDDYITVPGSESLDRITKAITLMAWVNIPSTSRHSILSRWVYIDTSERSFVFDIYNGKVTFGLSADGTGLEFLHSAKEISSNQWTHVAATSDGTTMKTYINGILDPNTENSPASIHPSTADLHIGRWMTGPDDWHYPFNGTMDEVKIFSRALSAEEIIDDYNKTVPTGTISGTVSESTSGNPIQGVTVSDGTRSDTTDAGGNYTIKDVPVRLHTVTASKSGYFISSIDGVIVVAKETTIVDFQLEKFPDLIGSWSFEDASGISVYDSSIYNNDGIIYGPTSTSGRLGLAYMFDGSGDHITIPGSASLNDIEDEITLISWVKTSADTKQTIIERYLSGSAGCSFLLNLNAGKVNFLLSENGTDADAVKLTSSGIVTNGAWTHVAATSDGSAMKIYLNGVLDSNTASSPASIYSVNSDIHIGRWEFMTGYWNDPFYGIMDEVKICKRALSAEEISDDYYLAPVGIYENPVSLAVEDGLMQVYPNPFNFSTTIRYKTAICGAVTLCVYNIGGQKMRTLLDKNQEADSYSVVWDGTNAKGGSAGSGIYFCILSIDNRPIATNKIVLLK